ncbi:MAG: hypothetical protein AAFY72_15890 [Cyanobacteria bacterium J06649_4]
MPDTITVEALPEALSGEEIELTEAVTELTLGPAKIAVQRPTVAVAISWFVRRDWRLYWRL